MWDAQNITLIVRGKRIITFFEMGKHRTYFSRCGFIKKKKLRNSKKNNPCKIFYLFHLSNGRVGKKQIVLESAMNKQWWMKNYGFTWVEGRLLGKDEFPVSASLRDWDTKGRD